MCTVMCWCLWPSNTNEFLKEACYLDIFIQSLVPEWSLNDKADVWPGTYFMCARLEVIELHGKIEWLNRGEISQSLKHSDQLAPGNIGNRLCQYKAAVSCSACPVFPQGGRGGQWLECHPRENWTQWELKHESKQTVISWHRRCLLEVPLQIFHHCGYWHWRGVGADVICASRCFVILSRFCPTGRLRRRSTGRLSCTTRSGGGRRKGRRRSGRGRGTTAACPASLASRTIMTTGRLLPSGHVCILTSSSSQCNTMAFLITHQI